MQQSLFESQATATAKAQAFDRQTLGELYRRANDLMRNVDGLQPQEAFDELLKYISLKESLEKHGISPSTEEVSALRELFGKYFHEMGEAAAELWKDRRSHLSEKCLTELHLLFQSLRLTSVPFDLRSAALHEFLTPQVRKGLGIFLTPDNVARMMVNLVSPPPRETVCDPACGTGTFLIEVLKHWQQNTTQDGKALDFTVLGIDKNPRMVLLAGLNLDRTGAYPARLRLADSLSRGTIKPNTCDVVFTNPPFGANVDSKAVDVAVYESARGLVAGGSRRVPSEVLFLDLCLRSLRPGGKLAIVLPRSVVTNGSLDASRRAFQGLGYVYAVVSLPSETFQAAGVQTTTVLLFARKYEENEDLQKRVRICMASVSNVGYDATGRARQGDQLPDLARQIRQCIETQEVMPTCSLSEPIPKTETFSRLPALLASRGSVHKKIKLGDILALAVCGRTPPRAGYSSNGLFLVKVGNLTGNGIDWSPRERNFVDPRIYPLNGDNGARYLRAGDILLTAAAHSPVYIAKKVDIVTAIPPEIGGRASFVGEVMLLRPNVEEVDPFVLLAYLRLPRVTKEIQQLIRGQTAHLYPDDILGFTVDASLQDPSQALKELSELARAEAEKFAELNRIMFAQVKLAEELQP